MVLALRLALVLGCVGTRVGTSGGRVATAIMKGACPDKSTKHTMRLPNDLQPASSVASAAQLARLTLANSQRAGARRIAGVEQDQTRCNDGAEDWLRLTRTHPDQAPTAERTCCACIIRPPPVTQTSSRSTRRVGLQVRGSDAGWGWVSTCGSWWMVGGACVATHCYPASYIARPEGCPRNLRHTFFASFDKCGVCILRLGLAA